MGLSLDLCLGVGEVGFFKLSFFAGWGVGCFYFEFLGDYFLLRGFFLLIFFLFCGGGLLTCV